MGEYRCTVCSYVYKPERGDWMHDIPKGTAFEDLPDDWRCPTCNQPKMAFMPVETQKQEGMSHDKQIRSHYGLF